MGSRSAGYGSAGHNKGINVLALSRPGTLIWTDPLSAEERYTAPGDSMYSTALMLATEYAGQDGTRSPWPDYD